MIHPDGIKIAKLLPPCPPPPPPKKKYIYIPVSCDPKKQSKYYHCSYSVSNVCIVSNVNIVSKVNIARNDNNVSRVSIVSNINITHNITDVSNLSTACNVSIVNYTSSNFLKQIYALHAAYERLTSPPKSMDNSQCNFKRYI